MRSYGLSLSRKITPGEFHGLYNSRSVPPMAFIMLIRLVSSRNILFQRYRSEKEAKTSCCLISDVGGVAGWLLLPVKISYLSGLICDWSFVKLHDMWFM